MNIPFFNSKKKSSRVSQIVSASTVGQPLWTPRRYDALADEGYQKNVIVYRCVSLIAKGLASVPFVLYERGHELEKHPILTLLSQPSPKQSQTSFLESVVGFLLLSGNGYIEAIYNDQGQPVELYPLRPDRMKVVPGRAGVPQAYQYAVNGYTKNIRVDEVTGDSPVLHLKSFHPLNDWYGMSPIEAAASAIDQHNAVASHNLAIMQNGGRPSGAFIVKTQANGMGLTPEQLQSLREDLNRAYSGHKNAGQILLMEGDCDWREMGLSPRDLDFISGKSLSAREIAQAYGVPPMLVGVPGDATFANYREARYHLWEDTILPLLNNLVSEFNRWLCPAFGEELRLSFDRDEIPALAPRREAVWSRIAQADFLTVNEKRQAVGYSPVKGGDRILPTNQPEGLKND